MATGGSVEPAPLRVLIIEDRPDDAELIAEHLRDAGLMIAWERVDSEADAQHAAVRTLLGFAGRMGSNAFQEFWPDVRRRIIKKIP